MQPRDRTTARFFGLILCVLAVSPVTAPFSTCDLVAVLCGNGSSAAVSIQSKISPDEPVPTVGGTSVLHLVRHVSAREMAADLRDLVRHAVHDLPLRI